VVEVFGIIGSFFSEFLNSGNLQLTLMFVFGMVVYAMFIFNFYRFLARKDLFKLDLGRYSTFETPFMEKFFRGILYILEYIFVLPIIVFFWFVVLSIMLVFLSKTTDVNNILLVAVAVVSSVRVTSYYNQDLSKDLAKLVPLSLLGVFLIDISTFSLQASISLLSQLGGAWQAVLSYLSFIILLEFFMRIITGFGGLFRRDKSNKLTVPENQG